MQKIIGYTAGVFDMFHIGHLNFFKNAKKYCDYLVVGVNSDELAQSYKKRKPIIPFEHRIEIVGSNKYVDEAVKEDSLDRLIPAKKYNASVVFIGSDWKNSERWTENERKLNEQGIKVIFLDYTTNVSTTGLINSIKTKD